MALLSFEHSKAAYRIDFALYGAAVAGLAAWLLLAVPQAHWPAMLAWVLAGLLGWTLMEYLLHRFVLHGLWPFRQWHAQHHERPTALICAPTLLSASLIGTCVFVPAWLLGSVWQATALTQGLLSGYLVYALVHHATHHGRTRSVWLKRRKLWHARHHHAGSPACYGVTSAFWDHVFGSAQTVRRGSSTTGSAHPETD
jgi:cyclopropane-fatty-acyl-phospholipid synthase